MNETCVLSCDVIRSDKHDVTSSSVPAPIYYKRYIDMLLMSYSLRCRSPQRKISYFLLLKGTTFVGDVQRHWSFLNILDFLFKSKNSFLTLCWLQVFFCYQKGSSKWGFQTSNLCVQAKTNPVILIFHMNITEKLAFFLCSRQVSTIEKYSMGFWSRINKYFCQDTKLTFRNWKHF